MRTPVGVPATARGDRVDVIGLLTRGFGDACPNTRRHRGMCRGRYRHGELRLGCPQSRTDASEQDKTCARGRSGSGDVREHSTG
ncbi:chaplin family protein [Streptomyces sp. NPDC048290]|uniref:chaplin family protein n=1 Tax=Streptomyces sp. NPDC048290 TaxID=3155811 RepID=UPI003432F484